jgi:hypothetical protein
MLILEMGCKEAVYGKNGLHLGQQQCSITLTLILGKITRLEKTIFDC